MAKREFLQLAKTYRPGVDKVLGWYMSEKLDGMRAFWDGGVSRGEWAHNVPWANTVKDTKQVKATGLWSRHGKVIHAPKEWLDFLPHGVMLDGELYLGPGKFQQVMSICRRHTPELDRWMDVRFIVFEAPTVRDMFYDSKLPWGKMQGAERWVAKNWTFNTPMATAYRDFKDAQYFLEGYAGTANPIWSHIHQVKVGKLDDIQTYVDRVLDAGGEGVMLRRGDRIWVPERTGTLLKVKPYYDAEGTVTGYVTGRDGLMNKMRGMLGALVLDYKGKRLELSGFTNQERELNDDVWAWDNPGTETDPTKVWAIHFPMGKVVTFKYRELTDDGIPKEARFKR